MSSMEDDEDVMYDGMTKVSVGDVKIGMIVMLKQRPCKVLDYHSGKTGKHGAAKALIKGCDIITDKHIETSAPTSKYMWIPNTERITFKFVDIEIETQNSYITVLNEESGETKHYKVNNEDDVIKYIIDHKDDGVDIDVSMLFVLDEHRVLETKIVK
jgi:translation initiation factor 5A